MGWEDIAPEVPMWKSEPECKNCKKLKEMYADSCSESDSLFSEIKLLRADCQRLEMGKVEALALVFSHEGHIAKLDGRIKVLEAELAKCQQVATPIGFGEILQSALDERDNLRTRHAALVTTTRAIAGSGIELDDNRIPYVVMQIDRSVLEELKAALAEVK